MARFSSKSPRDKLLVEHNRLWPVMAVAHGYGLGWTRAKLPSDDLTIRLVKDEPISGRLVDAQGQPVTDANIRIRDLYTGDGRSPRRISCRLESRLAEFLG